MGDRYGASDLESVLGDHGCRPRSPTAIEQVVWDDFRRMAAKLGSSSDVDVCRPSSRYNTCTSRCRLMSHLPKRGHIGSIIPTEAFAANYLLGVFRTDKLRWQHIDRQFIGLGVVITSCC